MNENKNNLNEEDIKTFFGNHKDENPQIIPPISTPPRPVQSEGQTVNINYQPSSIKNEKKYFSSVSRKTNGNFWNWISNAVKTLCIFIIIFTISFTILNFPAIFLKTKYFWQVERHSQPPLVVDPVIAQMKSKDNHLYIPKIGVDVPISWNISDEQTLTALEGGVAHYKGTALPGQIGNVFIYGHSSYYWWNDGSYKEIFALLDKLQNNDKIYISYHSTIFVYVVTGEKVVSPKNLEVLNPTDTSTLSLMTCVPVGTTLSRLVVTAKQLQ